MTCRAVAAAAADGLVNKIINNTAAILNTTNGIHVNG
jgi:hypothetical protein